MAAGKAHGKNREYQVQCRDILIRRDSRLAPFESDGIDVTLSLLDTDWTFDIALRATDGRVVVAECRRTEDAVKQGDVGAFAYNVEMIRKSLGIDVAGIFIAKRSHQLGAIKVGQFNGIDTAIIEEGAADASTTITYLRYDVDREIRYRDYSLLLQPAALSFTGHLATVVIKTNEDTSGH